MLAVRLLQRAQSFARAAVTRSMLVKIAARIFPTDRTNAPDAVRLFAPIAAVRYLLTLSSAPNAENRWSKNVLTAEQSLMKAQSSAAIAEQK